MAETTSELERIYTIPLRHAKHGTRSKRANRAIGDVRTFLTRHMKSDDIWIATDVNELIWARGKFTIPSKLRVRATRFSDGVVEVTLTDAESEGSMRDAIHERQEKAASTPVLAPAEEAEEESEESEEESEEDEAKAATEGEDEAAAEGDDEAAGEAEDDTVEGDAPKAAAASDEEE